MYRKNVAGQTIGFAAIAAADGTTMTGTAGFAAYRVIDGGAQASATGAVTDKGHGQYSFALSQADTDGNNVSILFAMTGMVAVEKTFVTTACDPSSASNFGITELDAAISSRSTYAGGDTSGTTTLLTRIPGTVQPQTGDSYAQLAAFAGAFLFGTVAASPSPTTTTFTVTLSSPISGSAAAGDFVGLYVTMLGGPRDPAARLITACVINSTTSLALTVAAFAAAPVAANSLLISA